MTLAFVVQRYGLDISGGAELHCRWVAEHMAKHGPVEVLTTCAHDYITWADHYPAGTEVINGVTVRRFPVSKPRGLEAFTRLQLLVLRDEHTLADELAWLDEEGPTSPGLMAYIREHEADYSHFLFFSYRYYQSYWGVKSVPAKSILVPTAEHDLVVHLRIFKELFRLPKAFIFNSEEERDMIRAVSGNPDAPGPVVGVGTVLPENISAERFRKTHGLDRPYILYLGRIDANKGCGHLFDYFLQFKRDTGSDAQLVLIGSAVIPVPAHHDIRHLGFLPEQDKFDALAGAELLVMPSFFESLSMVTLEAWALGKAVLANAHCDVLRGQCRRSNGGLYYRNYAEFRAALDVLLATPRLRAALGRNGADYFRSRYTWDIIERKYLEVLNETGA
jgi:glycosyltransferase involved in cell wall biosynthesis